MLSWRDVQAVLFDLDGVLISTVELHAKCWRSTLEQFLSATGAEHASFSRDDYDRYLDGRSRYDGASEFLRARGVRLKRGDPSDAPGHGSSCAVANAKAARYASEIARQAPAVYPGSRELLRGLSARGVRCAVVSASRNCAALLDSTRLTGSFGVRVDGNVAIELGLASKPSPAPFLEAARQLGVEPSRAMVVEDAIAGVAAGRAGRFGYVLGVRRSGSPAALRAAGAHRVVTDLRELDWTKVGARRPPLPKFGPAASGALPSAARAYSDPQKAEGPAFGSAQFPNTEPL